MGNKSNLNMFQSPTDPYEVAKLINSLKRKNSSGHDGLNSALIKEKKMILLSHYVIVSIHNINLRPHSV